MTFRIPAGSAKAPAVAVIGPPPPPMNAPPTIAGISPARAPIEPAIRDAIGASSARALSGVFPLVKSPVTDPWNPASRASMKSLTGFGCPSAVSAAIAFSMFSRITFAAGLGSSGGSPNSVSISAWLNPASPNARRCSTCQSEISCSVNPPSINAFCFCKVGVISCAPHSSVSDSPRRFRRIAVGRR